MVLEGRALDKIILPWTLVNVNALVWTLVSQLSPGLDLRDPDFASYESNGNELSFGEAGATRKMCPDMSVEDLFLQKLGAVFQYKVNKKELLLYDEKDQLIMLAIKE